MRAAVVLALLVSLATRASAAPVDPAEAWRPLRPFIGTWKGTRTGAEGPVKVTRGYVTAPTNQTLEITEKGGDEPRPGSWGTASLEPERQVLTLRQFAADGKAADLSFVPESSTADRLVFVSPESESTRSRITYERTGPRNFTERIERAGASGEFELVSETHFVRKD